MQDLSSEISRGKGDGKVVTEAQRGDRVQMGAGVGAVQPGRAPPQAGRGREGASRSFQREHGAASLTSGLQISERETSGL